MAPEVVIIGVETENHFDHPCSKMLKQMEELLVYRANKQGVIGVTVIGRKCG